VHGLYDGGTKQKTGEREGELSWCSNACNPLVGTLEKKRGRGRREKRGEGKKKRMTAGVDREDQPWQLADSYKAKGGSFKRINHRRGSIMERGGSGERKKKKVGKET